MSDPQHVTRSDSLPPPAPPLPPSKQGVLQRLVAPLGFQFSRHGNAGSQDRSGTPHHRGDVTGLRSAPSREETASHRTGIPIAALDISPNRTHAVLAGREILKTIRVTDGDVTEDFNVRSALSSYAARHSSREFLPATDVKWSHSEHDTKIATAASNGRVVIYDLTKPEIELVRLHEHERQVHRLAFNPFSAPKLLSGSQDGTLRLWDLRLLDGERGAMTMKSHHTFNGRAEAVRDIRWSTVDGFEFAFCTDSGSLQLWDFRFPNNPKLRITAHDKPCYALDWHPDGKHVATGGLDKDVKVWDLTNNDRRQKPTFVLRTPQAVMKLRWRPACWSSETQEAGDWQSTQLVTSYNQEDPRVHVWDLRRPYVPFRELDRYRTPPSDLLWHSKDLLWTVGTEGSFQQTDTKYAPQVVDQLNPCHISFAPDGNFVKISEKRINNRRTFGLREASDDFLNQRRDQDLVGKSRSWDDDDSVHEGMMSGNARRRQAKTSAKFPKSQGNTPPSRDERNHVIPLEKSIRRGGLFKNRQIGLIQEIGGASLDGPTFEYLARYYARPMTDAERKEKPEEILDRLEAVFKHNTMVCQEVSMYRLAQTWAVIGSVLLPELTAWAESNREKRIHGLASGLSGPSERDFHTTLEPTLSFNRRLSPNPNQLQATSKATGLDASNSAVTTPIARPLHNSHQAERDGPGLNPPHLDDSIDSIAPLPDSLISAHTTAALAADNLLLSNSLVAEGMPQSPPAAGHLQKSHAPSQLAFESGELSPRTAPAVKDHSRTSSPQDVVKSPDWRLHNPESEEDKRVALRDYRAQSRPLITFDDKPGLTQPAPPKRHDSNESFTMFSTSTASSQRTKSVGRSFESPQGPLAQPSSISGPEYWGPPDLSERDTSIHPTSPQMDQGRRQSNLSLMFGATSRDETSPHSSGEGSGKASKDGGPVVGEWVKPSKLGPTDSSVTDMQSTREGSISQHSPYGSPTEESLPFEFEPASFPLDDNESRPTLHNESRNPPEKKKLKSLPEVDALSPNLIYYDFRPMTRTRSEDKDVPILDTFSLVAAAIESDLTASHDNATCQLTAHVLMHISPFFDNFLPLTGSGGQGSASSSIASRLRDQSQARRISESAISVYLQFLLSQELYAQAAEVKKFAHESSYNICRTEGPSLAQELRLLLTCGHCGTPLGGENVGLICQNCKNARGACPICLAADMPSEWDDSEEGHSMWSTCLACGHGGHQLCLLGWFSDVESEGACPVPGCWHDCGPGQVREDRVVLQNALWQQEEANKAGKGGHASKTARKDSWVVKQSPAVGQARKELRSREPSFGRKQVRLLPPPAQLSSSH